MQPRQTVWHVVTSRSRTTIQCINRPQKVCLIEIYRLLSKVQLTSILSFDSVERKINNKITQINVNFGILLGTMF